MSKKTRYYISKGLPIINPYYKVCCRHSTTDPLDFYNSFLTNVIGLYTYIYIYIYYPKSYLLYKVQVSSNVACAPFRPR